MDLRPVQMPEIKISACPSAENEAVCPFVTDSVKQLKSFDFLRRLVRFSDPAGQNVDLVELSVMTAHLLLCIVERQRLRVGVTGNAPGIHAVCLRQLCRYSCVLGDIPVCH